MIAVKRFRHLAIIVDDIEKMIAFYTDVLGLKIKDRLELNSEEFRKGIGIKGAEAKGAHLFLPDSDFELELIQFRQSIDDKEKSCTNKSGYRHIAFIVENIEDVYNTLTNEGFEFISDPIRMKEPASVKGFAFIYMKDPEGNIIEFNQLTKIAD